MSNKMKVNLKKYKEFVQEMSTVDRFDKNAESIRPEGLYTVRTYAEPLGNPSFHFEKTECFEVVMQIKDLKTIEVKWEKKPINKQDLKILLKWFNNIDEEMNITNWDYMRKTWNKENPQYVVNYSKPNYIS